MIEIEELTVRYGAVVSLDALSLTFEAGCCGLIGPNGSGKTTFFNTLSGFTAPAAGAVRVDGTDLLAMPHFRRARWGLRRTFQTEQTISALTVRQNVEIVLDQLHLPRAAARSALGASLEFVGLHDLTDVPAGLLDQGRRRLLELARTVVGEPKVVLLDEPAAGLAAEESSGLGRLIVQIPERFGAQVVLVDHDMSVVQSCCAVTAVLDFGKLVAVGPTAEVLRDQRVMNAYLGEDVA